MAIRSSLQSFILGKREFVGAHSEFKSIILTGQMALVAYLVGIVYSIIDGVNHIKAFIPFYLILMLVSVIVLGMLRYGFYRQGKLVLLIAANLLVYIFVSNDSLQAGVYIYFFITPVMALSLFGFNERKIALSFSVISLVLFFLAYWGNFKIVSFSNEELDILNNGEYERISFLSNFIIGLSVTVLSFYFLLDTNQHSEKQILAKNEELSKTNEELDRFVYSASHDLRAPLRSILGLIGVAGHSQSKEELEECLDMMKKRINNLDKFIGEIIDYSRNSRQEVQKIPVHILTTCQHIVEELKFAQGMEDVTVHYKITRDLTVSTDPTRLKIILTNIIGNAMKYQDSSKKNHTIEIAAVQNRNNTELSIKDNGIGILPEHHQRIFDMFYRASEKSHGSGLGLYIVKETLSKLEGSIRFESYTGDGTTFYITLPA